MQAYEGFASIYDIFMGDVDYDGWVEYIEKIWKKYKKEPKLIAELGCGTGNITGRLAKKGYDMIGIDISEEMLSVAREKAAEEGDDILYLLQDMTEFELYGTVDIILSLCDSMICSKFLSLPTTTLTLMGFLYSTLIRNTNLKMFFQTIPLPKQQMMPHIYGKIHMMKMKK